AGIAAAADLVARHQKAGTIERMDGGVAMSGKVAIANGGGSLEKAKRGFGAVPEPASFERDVIGRLNAEKRIAPRIAGKADVTQHDVGLRRDGGDARARPDEPGGAGNTFDNHV